MNKVSLFFLGASLLMTGCGSVSGDGGDDEKVNDGNITVIDANFSIDLSNVPGFDNTEPINNQYIAIINYLRSLKIKCDDSSALSGPVGVDMQWDDHIAAAAKEHSDDMNKSIWYDHEGSGTVHDITGQTFTPSRKSTFSERIAHNGYSGSISAENIATMWSTGTPPADDTWITVMEGWMKSDHGHCSNIMHPLLTDFGMYESRAPQDADGKYKVYWTQDFGGQ